jgi:hypothetical protein
MLNHEVLYNVAMKLHTHMSFKSNTFETMFEFIDDFLWGHYYHVF